MSNKTVLIIGLGKTGLSAIEFFQKLNYQIYLHDDNQIILDKYCEQYKVAKFNYNKIDLLFVSPGIPNNNIKKHKIISWAKKENIPITSDIEIFQNIYPNAKFIGITGTNGKSTTTALTAAILKRLYGTRVAACGNIGIPVLNINDADIYVIELSSYQLDLLPQTKLDIAVCLNITPDHLNCYLNLNDYAKSKSRIFSDKSINIISADYDLCNQFAPENSIKFSREKILEKGISVINNQLYIDRAVYSLPKNQSLLGKYNAENIAAAISICYFLDVPINDILQGIRDFSGLPHRMEVIYHNSETNVTYINDSKATNTVSTRAAFEAMQGKKIIWILGGICKDDGIESLNEFFHQLEQVYLIGQSTDVFYEILLKYNIKSEKSYTLEVALNSIQNTKNCVVLLSPACASTDQWLNFEERGNAFRDMCLSKIKES